MSKSRRLNVDISVVRAVGVQTVAYRGWTGWMLTFNRDVLAKMLTMSSLDFQSTRLLRLDVEVLSLLGPKPSKYEGQRSP